MTPLYIAIAVALVCFVLYIVDRRMNEEPIVWLNAIKLVGIGGIVSGGIAYATMTPEVAIAAVAEVTVPVVETAQEMFVGTPSF